MVDDERAVTAKTNGRSKVDVPETNRNRRETDPTKGGYKSTGRGSKVSLETSLSKSLSRKDWFGWGTFCPKERVARDRASSVVNGSGLDTQIN